jgi:hypothetical protein
MVITALTAQPAFSIKPHQQAKYNGTETWNAAQNTTFFISHAVAEHVRNAPCCNALHTKAI